LEVLIDPLELAQGLDLLRLEAGDARRFLEDHPAFLRGRLQEHVHAALLDDAVGVGAGAAAEEHLLHVAEPAQLAVDEVLALAAAVDAAADLDFFARYAEEAPAVVEGHGALGHAEAAARRRAVENDVGHLAAAEALGALLAEDPADGVHDIGLSRSV